MTMGVDEFHSETFLSIQAVSNFCLLCYPAPHNILKEMNIFVESITGILSNEPHCHFISCNGLLCRCFEEIPFNHLFNDEIRGEVVEKLLHILLVVGFPQVNRFLKVL
jgi:hypothetical protein